MVIFPDLPSGDGVCQANAVSRPHPVRFIEGAASKGFDETRIPIMNRNELDASGSDECDEIMARPPGKTVGRLGQNDLLRRAIIEMEERIRPKGTRGRIGQIASISGPLGIIGGRIDSDMHERSGGRTHP